MTCRRLLVLAAGFLAICGALAAAQNNRPAAPPAPESSITEAPRVPSTVSPDATGLAVDPKSYVIGAEDILKISVWREETLSGAVACGRMEKSRGLL